MRIATSQLFRTGSDRISSQQEKITDQTGKLSSGKRVETAKDDPIANSSITRLQGELDRNKLYSKNADQAKGRNDAMEAALDSTTSLLDNAKKSLIQANSGGYDANDMKALIAELEASRDTIFGLANTTDENGNYVFAGHQTEQQPFRQQGDGSIAYQGDNGNRSLLIGAALTVPISQSGESVFMDVPNAQGDFAISYTGNQGSAQVLSADITDRANHDSSLSPMSLSFTDTNNDGQLEVTIADAGGNTTTNNYTAGQDIAYNGVDIQLSGKPLPGDVINLAEQSQTDVFSSLNNAIGWLQDSITTGRRDQVEYSKVLSQLDSSFKHMTTRQSASGARLSTIESQKDYLDNYDVVLSETKSRLEDLDFADAVSDYQQTQTALQVSQQLFTQVNRTSLLDYL